MNAGTTAAAMARAIKASGVLVMVKDRDFMSILARAEEPLVVCAKGGLFSTKYQYLTSYKGLAFFTKSGNPLPLPATTELVTAARIWIPG
jgi:hypothetical protein